jgi:hypothetical protein
MIMARRGVNCRRPPPSLTRVIHDSGSPRPVDRVGKSMHELFGVEFVVAFSTTAPIAGVEGEAPSPAHHYGK